MKKTVSLLTFLLVAVACHKKDSIEKQEIKKAEWLLGNWAAKSDFGILTESWKKINDSTFEGQSNFINSTKDTVHFETMLLTQAGQNLVYETIIKGQNANKPLQFPLISSSENELVFENVAQDYPKKISYIKKSNNTVIAKISGKQHGKESNEEFTLTKR